MVAGADGGRRDAGEGVVGDEIDVVRIELAAAEDVQRSRIRRIGVNPAAAGVQGAIVHLDGVRHVGVERQHAGRAARVGDDGDRPGGDRHLFAVDQPRQERRRGARDDGLEGGVVARVGAVLGRRVDLDDIARGRIVASNLARDLARVSSLMRVISRAAEKAAASALACMLRLLANQIEPSTAMPEKPSKTGSDSPI
jgi:hypothetical protein